MQRMSGLEPHAWGKQRTLDSIGFSVHKRLLLKAFVQKKAARLQYGNEIHAQESIAF
jgi:hypothetical protein